MKIRLAGCTLELVEAEEFFLLQEEKGKWNQLAKWLELPLPWKWGAVELQILAEAVNWGAKVFTPWFYNWKPSVVVAAVEAGAHYGWGDDDAFYLCTKEGGVCCFHDPNGDLYYSLKGSGVTNPNRSWPYQWSGVGRQEISFDLWNSLLSDQVLITEIAQATLPKEKLIEPYPKTEEILILELGLANPFENLKL